MKTSTSSKKSSAALIDNIIFNTIVPIIHKVFKVNGMLPTIPKLESELFHSDLGTFSGQIFFTIHIDVVKTGRTKLTIVYNINHDLSRPNTFTKLSIDELLGRTEKAVLFMLSKLIEMASEIPIYTISIHDITHIKPHASKFVDLLMILYTNQSVYSNLGFIQLTYPQLLTDIRLLLYTPIGELMMPEKLIKDVHHLFGVLPTANLNTLFFILYPKYITNTYTGKEILISNRIYKFLIDTYENVRIYTQTTIYVQSNIPSPNIIMTDMPVEADSKPWMNNNVMKLLKKDPSHIDVSMYSASTF
jgi:hypothetical protein